MKSANFMRRHYTIEQEKNMDRKRRNKMTALNDLKFDFSRFSQAWLFKQQSFSPLHPNISMHILHTVLYTLP